MAYAWAAGTPDHSRCRLAEVDPIRRDDIEPARRATPEEKARQALEMMRAAVRLKRAGLRSRHPEASEAEIDRRLREWLLADD